MPSVYEQIQKYRAQNAKNTAALMVKHPGVNTAPHPKTKDFFKDLMQRWQSSSHRNALSDAINEE